MSNDSIKHRGEFGVASMGDLTFSGGCSVHEASRLADTAGTADDLSAVLAHLAGVRAAADFRLLTTASQLHEECEEEYLIELAERRGEQMTTPAGFTEQAERAAAGDDPFEKYGPDGLERAVAEVGASVNLSITAARALIESGHALRYRLPLTGEMLAIARIDRPRFDAVVRQSMLVAEGRIAEFDGALSEEIGKRAAMSYQRFVTMVDAVIARIDPDALELRRENVSRGRAVAVGPDRRVAGQSRVSGRLTTADGARLDATLTSLATSVHSLDPRTIGQRRADALMALAAGVPLSCQCPDCLGAPPAPAIPNRLGASSWFHIVVNLSTLLGADDDLAYIDGHGLIGAETARELLAEARRSYVHSSTTTSGHTYRPSPRLADLVRCGELWCSYPGCNNRVFTADLDHLTEFNHNSPDDGGRTEAQNLTPLCRLHHRIKTFTDWRDFRDRQGLVVMRSPNGHITIGPGFGGSDLFPALRAGAVPPVGGKCLRGKASRHRSRLKRVQHRCHNVDPPPF